MAFCIPPDSTDGASLKLNDSTPAGEQILMARLSTDMKRFSIGTGALSNAALKVQVQQFSKGNCSCQKLTNICSLRKEL